MIRIWADFNAVSEDLVPLDFVGSLRDIKRQGVELRRGLRIVVYDDEREADAEVESVLGVWCGRILPESVRYV